MTARAIPTDTVKKDDILVFPMSKNVVLQHGQDAHGAPALTLFYGASEITFDDPAQFGFGEMLARQTRFRAGDAQDWCSADWSHLSDMMSTLVDAGVIRHARSDDTDALFKLGHEDRPSPLPPAPSDQPRNWAENGEALMRALTGQPLEMGYLETVVPIFRVAHLFLDDDGRQVGEANVFPAKTRLDVATQWRTCTYAGTRYQAEKPMNVTALRAMRAHWRQMMALLLHIRDAYLNRFPKARDGWTVGDLERLSTAVLALPSFMLLRGANPVANGALHPALSNLFRVTDGLRMTMHQMLFIPFHEPMRRPDEKVSAAEIFAYAERNYSFHSARSVCAGPQFMIEEFLAVIIDGTPPKSGLPGELVGQVRAAADVIELALDYGLLGLQTFGAVFSTWPPMTRCYHDIHQVLQNWPQPFSDPVQALRTRFALHYEQLTQNTHLANEAWREHREAVYDDMYVQCVFGVTGARPDKTLNNILTPRPSPAATAARQELRQLLALRLGDDPRTAEALDALAAHILEFLLRGQASVRLAQDIQCRVNAVLERPAPRHRLKLADLHLHQILMDADVRTLPFLLDELVAALGIRCAVDSQSLEIRGVASACPVNHSVTSEMTESPVQFRTTQTERR